MVWQAQGTRWLTQSSFRLAPTGRHRRRWIAAGAVTLLLAALAAVPLGNLLDHARRLDEVRSREAMLAAEVQRLETRLAVEAATRRELEQQAAELNTHVAELAAQVEFLRSRNTGSH